MGSSNWTSSTSFPHVTCFLLRSVYFLIIFRRITQAHTGTCRCAAAGQLRLIRLDSDILLSIHSAPLITCGRLDYKSLLLLQRSKCSVSTFLLFYFLAVVFCHPLSLLQWFPTFFMPRPTCRFQQSVVAYYHRTAGKSPLSLHLGTNMTKRKCALR